MATAEAQEPKLREVEAVVLGLQRAAHEGTRDQQEQQEPVRCDGDDTREPTEAMLFLFCCVGALEGADVALLPAVLLALQKDLDMPLTDLGQAMIAQAVLQNIAAPLWGVLADRGVLRRKSILIAGSLGQGAVTALLAVVTNFGPMVFLRGLNGAMLAALRPITNGMVADVTAELRRGKVYSRIQSSLTAGMIVTSQIAVPISTEHVLGCQGWRVAFVAIGALSVVVSALLFSFMEEPRHAEKATRAGNTGGARAFFEETMALLRFFRMPTFNVMIIQGIFGTIPWTVMGMLVLFYQLCGLSNIEAATLATMGGIAGIGGNLLGGNVCDKLAKKLGKHGRPLGAQISVASGLPLMWLILWGVHPGEGTFFTYAVLSILFSTLATWCQAGVNLPILSDIVPEEARNRIMAWECALENSIASLLGPPIVTLLSVKVFGYTFGEGDDVDPPDVPSAIALGKALATTICVPGIVCFFAYTLLHWSYPRDTRALLSDAHVPAEEAAQEAQGKAKKGRDEGAAKSGNSFASTKLSEGSSLDPASGFIGSDAA